ncbi:MAG: site-specific DNA-methyltransferase [Candidatus Bathyarchaeota archaeon]|jgi:site-specific DNA-methyltransferase (adenine-specific)|nr:site-specific DNA-methyltransferase [Candidatus Bathyarchaeota archaeon]
MREERKKRGTKTRSFGASSRESHDSTPFYNSRLYRRRIPKGDVTYVENAINDENLDKIFCKSSERMDELPDCSVHLMITSPPYNVSKEYDMDLTLEEYRNLLKNVFKEVHRVLVPGGRACVNVANVGRKPYLPLHSYIIQDLLSSDVGFLMRGEIIWNKAASSGTSTAWGSWKSARNPTLRDVHEYILVFSKDTFSRGNSNKKSTISREDFLTCTKSVWTFPTESARKIGHPAPFPVELPQKLIELYTFEQDLVLDPFIGSGTTAIACIKTGRHFVGYDIKEEYVELAQRRIRVQAEG